MVDTRKAERATASLVDRLGIYPPLAWGFLGLLIFMTGVGVESGYLSPYLVSNGISQREVALVFTLSGVSGAIAAWLSGALSDLWGPRQVMWAGLGTWTAFEIAFLVFGVRSGNFSLASITYALRGVGYPLFAYGFLVWIAVATPPKRLGTAAGWFWFAFTAGFPTLGSLFASYFVAWTGPYRTLWWSLALTVLGGLVAMLGIQEPLGKHPTGQKANALRTVLSSITIIWQEPKVGIGGVVRTINTASEFGFLVFLPRFFTVTVGFTMTQWLRLLSVMFLSSVVWNLLFGVIGDRFGWRQTVALCGGVGCAVSTLLLYYTPRAFGANYPLSLVVGALYGATLSGYVPLSALMPCLAPERKGAAMSVLNLGAGASAWVGPAIVALLLPVAGVVGVMWTYAVLYLISGALTLFLTLPLTEDKRLEATLV
jgi:polyol permease family